MKSHIIAVFAYIMVRFECLAANETLTTISDSLRDAKSMSDAIPDTHYESEYLCRGEWTSPPNCVHSKCDYRATWEYVDDNDEIIFTVSTKNRNKWTGIGFSENQLMPETDAVLGLVEESGRFFLMDSWLRAYEAPPLDQTQNLYNMTAWRENGITTLRFVRKRITGDSKDFQFTDTNCPYLIFPVMGGVFNAVNKRIRKHEITPIISDRKVCIRSCKVSTTTMPTTLSSVTELIDSDNHVNKNTLNAIQTTVPTISPNNKYSTDSNQRSLDNKLDKIENESAEKESKESLDEQMKWLLIFIGVAALVGLVVIQALCMLCRDSSGKTEAQPSKDKQMDSSHWKDYATNPRSAYTYDNYAADDIDGTVKASVQQSEGRPLSKQQIASKQFAKNGNESKLLSEKYQSATLERNVSPNASRMNEFGSAYATHDRRDPYYRNFIHPSFSQSLQPDFYFMPHQRRYSGEVVKVFVDYNNPQYAPK